MTRSIIGRRPGPRPAHPDRWEHDDRLLGQSLAGGDQNALRFVHERYGPAVFGLVRRIVRDQMGAEDVFQQVMTEMWLRASSFDADRGSFIRWLMTLARSRALDELRRRRPEPIDPADVALQGVVDDSLAGVLGEWELSYLLTTLPDDEREVIAMRFREDLSQSEIATRTGLPLGTVKTRMNRGLTRLRTSLTAEDAP